MATSGSKFEYRTMTKDITPNAGITPNRDTIRIVKEATFAQTASQLHKGMKTAYTDHYTMEPNAGHNATVNHFTYTPLLSTLRPSNPNDKFEFTDPIVDDRLTEEATSAQSENLIQKMDKDREDLKREAMENTMKKSKKNQTLQKPEYISLEEIQRQCLLLFGNMDGIHATFLEKKRKEKITLQHYLALNDGVDNLNEEQLTTLEGIRHVIEMEEVNVKKRSDKLKAFCMKELAKRGVFRIGYNNHRPVEEHDDRYIKRYARYLLMKKISEKVTGDEDDEYEREYENYVFTANSVDSPCSLSFNNDKPNKTKKIQQKKKPQTQSEVKDNLSDNQKDMKSAQSFIAFIKMIFAMVDKDKNGLVNKEDVQSEMHLNDMILQDLGFDSNEEFLNSLNDQIEIKTELTEKDFIQLLLSKSDIKTLINQFMTKTIVEQHKQKRVRRNNKSKDFDNDDVQLSDEDEENNLPGLKTHVFDFLQLENDKMKLDKLNEILFDKKAEEIAKINGTQPKTIIKVINDRIKISYHEYLTFLQRFHTKDQINFTIPKPFEFLRKDYQHKKMLKIQEILKERVDKEDSLIGYQFHANKLKEGIWGSRMQNIVEYERTQRRARQEKLKEKIVAEMKPFTFYETDERKYRERLQQVCEPPSFPLFRANAVRWMSQVNLYEDMIKKQLEDRKVRVQERMAITMKAAKMPPRMQAHADELKKKAEEEKLYTRKKARTPNKNRFKAKPVPDFIRLQGEFEGKLEEMKKAAIPTQPLPFTFHEPKKKMELRDYLDNENDPDVKNPQYQKKTIAEVIEKMQRKPKYEPSTTKSLTLLMETRRREIEEKQRKEDEMMLEDQLRQEKQDRLRERVQTSKALVDNKRELAENKQRIQDEFRMNLQKKKESYDAELQKRLQKVYNKPLMLEQIGNKGEKISLGRNMKDLNDILIDQGEEEQSEEIGQGHEEVDD